MFSLDYSIVYDFVYFLQYDTYLKIIPYFFGVFLSFEFLRNQVSEVNLLQLIPGVYFLLFFLFFVILLFLSNALFQFSSFIDEIRKYGTKTGSKFSINITFRYSISLLFLIFCISLNNFIPLTLDSLIFSGQKTLENVWSFLEVLLLIIVLIFFLVIISQIPLIFSFKINNQILVREFTRYWKQLLFFLAFLSGLLTPTLDAYTQLNFAFSIFLFYLLIINFLQKRILLKNNNFLGLN